MVKRSPLALFEEQQKRAADGLSRLASFAVEFDLNIIVENHGGLSSNGKWLSSLMREVDHPKVGTLPDFGNFVTNHEDNVAY